MAGLAQLVERLTAEWKVTGLIPGVRPLLRVLKKTEKKKVLPLHCKKLDLRMARMTMQNGGPVSSWRRKKIPSPISTLRAKYLDTDK